MANISFQSKRGLIEHGFKDVAIRQRKDSDYWLNFKEGKNLKLFWRMRSDEQELLRQARVAEDAYEIELDEIDEELAERAGFSTIESLRDYLKEKYGEDYDEHKYVVLTWEM